MKTSTRLTLSLTLIMTLVLTGCAGSKWDQSNPDMPEELRTSLLESIEKHEALILENEQNLDAQFELGFVHQQLGNYREAVKYYKKVLEISPGYRVALNNLADIYEQVEEYDLAAKYIKELYPQDQTNPEVIRDTVRILLKAGDVENATSALENFAELVREDITEAETMLISDLYEQIASYKNAQ